MTSNTTTSVILAADAYLVSTTAPYDRLTMEDYLRVKSAFYAGAKWAATTPGADVRGPQSATMEGASADDVCDEIITEILDEEKFALRSPLHARVIAECDSLRERLVKQDAEITELVGFIEAIFNDTQFEGRWPHLSICNFGSERIGNQYCNCPLGKRIFRLRGRIDGGVTNE